MEKEELAQYFETRTNPLLVSPYIWAMYYFTVEENEKGFEWLNKAYERRDHLIWYLKVDQGSIMFAPIQDIWRC